MSPPARCSITSRISRPSWRTTGLSFSPIIESSIPVQSGLVFPVSTELKRANPESDLRVFLSQIPAISLKLTSIPHKPQRHLTAGAGERQAIAVDFASQLLVSAVHLDVHQVSP